MNNPFAQYGILIDGSSLKKQGTTAAYEGDVKIQLNLIAGSDTGKALLRAIKAAAIRSASKNNIVIRPTSEVCNAETGTRNLQDATPRGQLPLLEAGAGPAGVQYRPVAKRPTVLGFAIPFTEPRLVVGTGAGSGAVISYDPARLGSNAHCGAGDPPGAFVRRADVTLLHELVHAYRVLRGNYRHGQVYGPRMRYHNEEEFFAILVGNIYASDPTSTIPQPAALRADHESYAPLEPGLATTAGFYGDAGNRQLISKFVAQEPGLGLDLATVPANFNPIAEHVNQWKTLSARVKSLP